MSNLRANSKSRPELDHYSIRSSLPPSACSSSPTNPKRPFGFRPTHGLATSTSSLSTTNLRSFSKTTSFSSTAAKFKPFSKYRSRRPSDDSLTDLSPPTHSDLDQISPHWNVALDHQANSQPSSPLRSQRNSAIFLGNSKPPSVSNKPSKESSSAGNMNLFKSHGSQPSFSSRLRLLSKNSSERQTPEKSKPSLKSQLEPSPSRSLKPAVLKPFQSKAGKQELEPNNSTALEEFEAIQSPPCDLRIVANPNYPPRSFSIAGRPVIDDSFHELSRSSSSPNLNKPTTFSQRLSGESVRSTALLNVTGSPKRNHAPPPIKVPKLRASTIAIAIGSEASPIGVCPKPISRHNHSRSECGNHFVRRLASLEWHGHGKKSPAQEPLPDRSKQPAHEVQLEQKNHNRIEENLSVDIFDALAASTSPRSGVISISNSSKVIKDKAPDVMPLQPAPRRLSGYAHHSSTDSKGPTMPLLISKHSRSVGNTHYTASQHRVRSSMCSESATLDLTVIQSSTRNVRRTRSSSKISFATNHSRYPETPKQSANSFLPNSSWSPIHESTEKQEICPATHGTSPGSIPFPTAEWSSQLDPSPIEETIASSGDENETCGIHIQNRAHRECQVTQGSSPPGKNEVTISGKNRQIQRATSFDIRNFPLHLDTSQRPDALPVIAIPQPIIIPQFVCGGLPALPGAEENIESYSKSSIPVSNATIRPYESSDLSSLRSIVSNGSSAEAWRGMNRIFTPSSTPPSNHSSEYAFRAISQKATPLFQSGFDSTSRSLSVDDFYLNINSNALLDLSRREIKKVPRPRSMSDRGPSRYEILAQLLEHRKNSIYSQKTSPFTAERLLSSCTRAEAPQSSQWLTASIAQKIRESTRSELENLVTEALKIFHSDSHRFMVGDIKELIREGRKSEQKAEKLRRQFIADLNAREKLLHRNVMTLQALNGDKGARFGESILKVVMNTDQLTSELLGLIDHTSKVDRMCEAHWRAAATVQMNNLAMKEAQLEAAQSRIEQLESDRARHVKQISDLQAKVDAIHDQARPSSRATDSDSVCSGPLLSVRKNSKNSQELSRDGIVSDSPSSTPRMGHFPYHCPQQLPHANLVQSRVRFNSTHSFGSSHSWNAPFENGSNEGGCSAILPEPVSPRTAFLSPYGLAHNQAASHERSESSSSSLPGSRNEGVPKSPRKTHKPSFSNVSLTAHSNSATNFQRSESFSSKKAQATAVVPRNILANSNSIKHKGHMNGIHLKSNRSSSLNASDLKIEVVDSNMHGPQDPKPRSTSNTFLPYLKSGTPPSILESSSIDASNEFQSSNTASRGPSSSSLSRFPRQAAPAPKLPLPYESHSRRRGQWSPTSPPQGNLSSITLSQLGSIDIANLLTNIESSSQ
ncbi:hypothetical protein PtA15_10A649 [Puccinia triticina]|uniref:Up-regulated during septation protein 1 domain-containing protein n=2 Tax=Puccinia triticina TaxID=208348 RepID=A0ABY7CZL5_9BASI|nr:uncharacterized protein PtA15_10A649 [Puccinia triticina]WAQ89225.1 hypothetical protein PtA15_10A649 [Puccinia triticina]